MSLDNFAAPIVSMSSALSSTANSAAFKQLGRLMGLQMQMLGVLSEKLDVVHGQLNILLDGQAEIAKKLDAVSTETVMLLYKNDLEGLFFLIREKIEGHEDGLNTGRADRGSTEQFSRLLHEFQVARSKILSSAGFLYIPLVTMCLHHELLLIRLADYPASHARSALRAYQRWLGLSRNGHGGSPGVLARYEAAIAMIEAAALQVKGVRHIKWSTTLGQNMRLDPGGDPNIPFVPADWTVIVTGRKTQLKRTVTAGAAYLAAADPLVAKGLIREEWLPCKLTSEPEAQEYTFTFKLPLGPTDVAPLVSTDPMLLSLAPDFVLQISSAELVSSPTRDLLLDAINAPAVQHAYSEGSDQLLIYAALLDCCDQALQLTKQLLEIDATDLRRHLFEISAEAVLLQARTASRAAAWYESLQSAKQQIQDEAVRNRVEQLQERMKVLSTQEGNIIEEFRQAERELAEVIPDNLLEAIAVSLRPLVRELERGVDAVVRETEIFARNVATSVEKAGRDVGAELVRAVDNTKELVAAAGGYLQNTVMLTLQGLSDAQRRISEGKLIDALWHLGISPITNHEQAAFIAVTESNLLRAIASSAASIYGAPYGAAAFAAWYTYRVTGDLNAALKIGVLSFATSQAGADITKYTVGSIPAGTTTQLSVDEVVRRSLVSATLGAAAIAASGGSEKDIIDGFLKGAAMTMASSYYYSVTNSNIDGRAPTRPAIDKDAITDKRLMFFNKEGKLVLDIRTQSKDITHVGIASSNNPFVGEGSWPMQKFSELPYMNDMAYFHDQVCAIEGFNIVETVTTIPPAIVVTVAGTPAPLLDSILETALADE